MSFLYWALVGFLCLALPVFAVLSGSRDRQRITKSPELKIRYYQETLLLLLLMGGFVLVAMTYEQDPISRIGLGFVYEVRMVVGLVLAVGVSYLLIRKIKVNKEQALTLVKKFEPMRFMLPINSLELKWTSSLSLLAGVFEEIVYRGFIYEQFNLFLWWPLALVATNLIFALMHFATGSRNMLNVFLLGVAFSVAYVLTGSLWLSIFLHIIVDLYAMMLSFRVYQQLNLNA